MYGLLRLYLPTWCSVDSGLKCVEPLTAHFTYMEKLERDGVLCLGGPFKNDAGAFGIVQTVDLEGASALVAADPAVLDGIFIAEVHPWHPAVSSAVEAKTWM